MTVRAAPTKPPMPNIPQTLEEPMWTSKDGRKLAVKDMDDNHLCNAIRKIIRDNWRKNMLGTLQIEATKRGLDWKNHGRWQPDTTVLEIFGQLGD